MPQLSRHFTHLRELGGSLERFLLPAACLLCGEGMVGSVEARPIICGLCQNRWTPLPHPLCSRCGQPVGYGIPCRICADWPAALGRVRSAVWLEGGARQATHLLKYEGWWGVARPMAQAMRRLAPLTEGVFLIPIPLGRRRQRSRGYNQSDYIAQALEEACGLPLRPGMLRRIRETPTQTALTPEARRANVADAFAATGADGVACVLVDDVFTTGA
ncbi:MAG: ComF family protein, partial [Gemmatimonadales bacterium]|nr:ComF family protein [Gemmatimonadales bacterium]